MTRRIKLILILTLMFSLKSYAQTDKFKALFIFNFIKYTEWPSRPAVYEVGVIGESEVSGYLKSIFAVKKEAKINVTNISAIESLDKFHLLYLPSDSDKKFDEIMTLISGKSILLVSESKNLAKKGAGISFYLENGKLKFVINKGEVDSRKLLISSNLIKLAKVI